MTDNAVQEIPTPPPSPSLPVATSAAWRSWWPVVVLVVAFLLMTGHILLWCARGNSRGDGDDHLVRREFGRRFVQGEPLYSGLICFNYMPVAAMFWAPLAWVSPAVGKVLHYAIAVAGLALSLYLLSKMVRPYCPVKPLEPLAVAALTVVLTAHYVGRDLGDAGPQTPLLALMVGGIYLAWRGRDLAAAICFSLPIAIKITPGLLIPFLLWKRRWRLAAWTTLATLGWIALPAVWMGWGPWWEAQQTWNEVAWNGLLQRPSVHWEYNNVRVQNQALQPALLRLLVTYPTGHPLRLEHPADVPLGNLDPQVAKRITLAVMAGLALLCAWLSRRPYRSADDPAWVLEASGLLILSLLFSPLVWVQHIGWILPAVYLLVAHDRTAAKFPLVPAVLIWVYVLFALILQQEVVGKANYLVLLSYHMHTASMLIILALLLWLRPLTHGATRS